MLTNFEVALYCTSLVLMPLATFSLATGSKAPPDTWIARYYDAEKWLGPSGNIMLIALSLQTLVKLAVHFGMVAQPSGAFDLSLLLALPATLLVYLGFWINAIRKVRRA